MLCHVESISGYMVESLTSIPYCNENSLRIIRELKMVKHSKKSTLNICAYCGTLSYTTPDHIPPKNLFPKPWKNLISVPACKVCHANTSKDDEYFRLKILMREDVLSNPGARIAWKVALRSLTKTEATGLRKKVVLDLTNVEMRTQSGLYVGTRPGYNVDMNRIRSVLQRIVRGLYFRETGNVLGLNTKVHLYMDDDFIELPSHTRDEIQPVILYLASLPPITIGENIFLYRYHIAKKDSTVSAWGLSFYGKFPFLAMTGPSTPKPV